jgi:hypothetical protein
MHLVYGECLSNSHETMRRYAERFPNRRHPNRKTFEAVARRLRETGYVLPKGNEIRRPKELDIDKAVLQQVKAPDASTRELGRQLVSHWSIWNILHKNLLYPYHIQRVQSLTQEDYPRRQNFCEWLLQENDQNPMFVSKMLMTDECCFTRNGILNFHNTHYWADANPYRIRETNFQHRFAVNVWAGIIGNVLIGPWILPQRLNADIYLNFLRNSLPELLEELPLAVRAEMWFMHDGAPPHFSRNVRNFLNVTYPPRWIGRGGPTTWPPTSPDLNTCDFYLWGHMKALVYKTPVGNQDDLLNRGMLRVQDSLIRRAHACVDANGGHFEHLL